MKYEFICNDCDLVYEVEMKMSEYTSDGHSCQNCQGSLSRYFGTPPNFVIPGNMTHDGKVKVSGGNNKQILQVPINIIDEKPGGGYKVTRIGQKKDIDNE